MSNKSYQSLVASFISNILDDAKRLEMARVNARTFAEEDKNFNKTQFFNLCNVEMPKKDETAILAQIENIKSRITDPSFNPNNLNEINLEIERIRTELQEA